MQAGRDKVRGAYEFVRVSVLYVIIAGDRCESDLDECLSQPCQNDAICRDDIGHYICYCRHGYTGVNCHIDIDECLSSPCLYGRWVLSGLS